MKLSSTTANLLILTGVVALVSACSTPSEPPAASVSGTAQHDITDGIAAAPSASASAAAASGVAAKATAAKSDLESIQGNWKGEEVGGDEGSATLAISGRDIEYRGTNPNDWYKGTLTLREDTNPKQCTFVVTGCGVPDYIGKNCMSIYQMANGTLTIAGNEPGNPDAPSAFGAANSRLFKFKKQ
jgi:uncharacterized protein (TIGR03067 family)